MKILFLAKCGYQKAVLEETMRVSINRISDYYSKLNLNLRFNQNHQGYFTCKVTKTREKNDPESDRALVRLLEQEKVNHEAAKTQMSEKTVSKSDIDNRNGKDFFLTRYNDLVAQNFGLLFDVRV